MTFHPRSEVWSRPASKPPGMARDDRLAVVKGRPSLLLTLVGLLADSRFSRAPGITSAPRHEMRLQN
jgi:hypothetical protein